MRLRRLQFALSQHHMLLVCFDLRIFKTEPPDCSLAPKRIENFLRLSDLFFAVPFVPDTFPARSSFNARQLRTANHPDPALLKRPHQGLSDVGIRFLDDLTAPLQHRDLDTQRIVKMSKFKRDRSSPKN